MKRLIVIFLVVVLLLAGGLLAFNQFSGDLAGPGQADALIQLPTGEALVWQVGGMPGRPAGLGTLFWHAQGQEPVNLSDVPDEGAGTRVFACGADAYAADGAYFVAYIGGEMGHLYRVPLAESGAAALQQWGTASALACNGAGRATFTADESQWVYIDFEADAVSSIFPDGVLRVLNTADAAEALAVGNVTAFTLAEDGLYYVQFFTDGQGLADEAAITYWDGENSRELTALYPTEDCDWRSAALDTTADGVVLSMGERCNNGSMWRLYSITDDGAVTEHVYAPSGGAYLPTATINQVYALDGGAQILATYPNGRLGNLANLVMVNPSTNAITLIAPEAIVDGFPGGMAQHMQVSPDGEMLAYVSATANDEYAIHRLPLDGSTAPVSFEAGPRGDVISALGFTPGGDLVWVAGGADGGDNSLWLLPAASDDARRVIRGNFVRDYLYVTDEMALLLEYVAPDDDYEDAAANLVAITLEGGGRGMVVEGRAAQAWAAPLFWR